ncbi:thiol oxidoreductase [Prevotella sp. CAG:1124]|nr:thiol oxidoreductase [Prevotella sp. CAG:1124]
MRKIIYPFMAAAAMFALSACTDDDTAATLHAETDANYVGTAQGNFTAEEWYPGGTLGTTDNVYAGCYEDETPATDAQGLMDAFNEGEQIFERSVTISTPPFKGLGPASTRRSCLDCHPSYGHGKRFDTYTTAYGNGNGYLLVIYHPNAPGSNDGPYISEVTAMPQTQAPSPFLPPIRRPSCRLSTRARYRCRGTRLQPWRAVCRCSFLTARSMSLYILS